MKIINLYLKLTRWRQVYVIIAMHIYLLKEVTVRNTATQGQTNNAANEGSI